MRVPFTWKPTGWFMVAWSAEIAPGQVKPLQYFGGHQVAYRTLSGELHVLDAHCPHLGAHLGHGGKVQDDCIVCPYHGWGYGPDGVNRFIPYEDRPNVSHSLKRWPVDERHECVFVWHDPAGGPPRWELPDIWTRLPELASSQDRHYRAYPEMSIKYEREPVHPQIPLENAPDSAHFRYVHDASVTPELLDWGSDGPIFQTSAGWRVPTEDGSGRVALRITSVACGVGGTFAYFDGSYQYRLAFFHTPMDDEASAMFYSIWWPKEAGDGSDVVPEHVRERAEKEFLSTLEDDLEIWRYQVYVEHPALAKQDARPYGALRKWARQFYEVEP
ncbi:MAG: Rieske 2Fe-2S domain-containing protein [Acidimicrobiia bacterium]